MEKNLSEVEFEKRLNDDVNLIKLFEADPDKYLFSYARLYAKYPEMRSFVYPQYEISENKGIVDYRTMFNCILASFVSMMKDCPYICLLTGFKPSEEKHEFETKCGIKLNPIYKEYYVREDEANDVHKLTMIYIDDGIPFHNNQLMYFTKMAKVIEMRHKNLEKNGLISKPFTKNEMFEEIDTYLKTLNNSINSEYSKRNEKLGQTK